MGLLPLCRPRLTGLKDFLVNIIPALVKVPDWFPGTGWKKTAREWRQQKDEIVQATYEWAKAQRVSTLGTSNCAADLILGPKVDRAGEQTIIGTMMEQAPTMDIKQEETDNYLQEIAITLMAGTLQLYQALKNGV